MIEEKHNTDVKAGGQYPLNEVERASLFCQLVTGIYFHIIQIYRLSSLQRIQRISIIYLTERLGIIHETYIRQEFLMNIFFQKTFIKRERVLRTTRLFGIWLKILSYIIFLIKRLPIRCNIETVCIIEITESAPLKSTIHTYYSSSINITEWLITRKSGINPYPPKSSKIHVYMYLLLQERSNL